MTVLVTENSGFGHWRVYWLLYLPSGSIWTKSHLLPTQCIYVFSLWIWQQTAIISLYNINGLVFITETGCVYCAVRTGSLYTARFNIQQFYVLPTQCIYVFCVDLRINNDYFPIQHKLTGLYNRDGVYLLRGTDWIFIYRQFNIQQFYVLPTQCIYVFCVDLRTNSDFFPMH